jgi:hypothetical protein
MREFFSGLLMYLKEEPNAKAGVSAVLLTSINLCFPASSLNAVASAKAPAKKSEGSVELDSACKTAEQTRKKEKYFKFTKFRK